VGQALGAFFIKLTFRNSKQMKKFTKINMTPVVEKNLVKLKFDISSNS
jgi:hypothetical protein